MSKVEILGIPQSTYTRVVRMACEEKGVDYELKIAPPHSPEINAIHPFGKIPALRHAGVELCESKAIATYVDRVFDGPKLIPDDPGEAAAVEEWVSLVNTVIDPTMIRSYVLSYVFPKGADGNPDRAVIDAVLPALRKQMEILDRAVAKSGHLAGNGYTFADMNLMPILFYVRMFPEGGEAFKACRHLPDYFDRHSGRASFKNTMPPPPPAQQSQPS